MSSPTADITAAHGHADDGHDAHGHHDPHLAHHFDSMEQQYDTGKTGMWVFLGTELLMFGGLFCAYSVYRANNPDVFLTAHKYLDTTLGAINTAVLLASSLTMAWAVRCSQLNQTRGLIVLLLATLLGGYGFMTIKAVEYNHKFHLQLGPGGFNKWNPSYKGDGFNNATGLAAEATAIEEQNKAWAARKHATTTFAAPGVASMFFDPNARTADAAKIIPQYGGPVGLAGAEGPQPTLVAPDHERARGGEGETHDATDALDPSHGKSAPHVEDATGKAAVGQDPKQEAHGGDAHAGTDAHGGEHEQGHDPAPPTNALDRQRMNTFFGIYYVMTGLHGIHVLVGMLLIFWLACRAVGPKTKRWLPALAPVTFGLYIGFVWYISHVPLIGGIAIGTTVFGLIWLVAGLAWSRSAFAGAGEFSSAYFAPVDLVGLYWHIVDLIWIFLFPLLYLIHGKL